MDFLMELINYLARWGHFVFGIAWIGLLYYFNFVQGAYAAVATADAKVDLFTKQLPNAMWWFRWAAMMTFLTGLVLLYFLHEAGTLREDILLGGLMAILMFLNVWLIIWPNQKIVIASNESVANGGEADPGQADAAATALLASRTNTLFSMPMLFFMGSSAHYPMAGDFMKSDLGLLITVIVVLAIEANAIWGKLGPIATVKGVITNSLLLTAVLALILYYV